MPQVRPENVTVRGFVLIRFDGENLHIGDVVSREAAEASLRGLDAQSQIEAAVVPIDVTLEIGPIINQLIDIFEAQSTVLKKFSERITREAN